MVIDELLLEALVEVDAESLAFTCIDGATIVKAYIKGGALDFRAAQKRRITRLVQKKWRHTVVSEHQIRMIQGLIPHMPQPFFVS